MPEPSTEPEIVRGHSYFHSEERCKHEVRSRSAGGVRRNCGKLAQRPVGGVWYCSTHAKKHDGDTP